MAGLQTIIDNAVAISINRKKVAAQTISRSGRIKTSEIVSAVPYQFSVSMHQGLTYSANRALTEEIDRLDITEESNINIGGTNAGLSYITAYQGDISSAELGDIYCVEYNGKNLIINTTNVTGAGTLFKAGDYIQPDSGYRYVYTVTEDVAFTTSANLSIPVHRAVIAQTGYTFANKGLLVGSDVSWRVKMVSKPNYTIVPYDRLAYDNKFELIEVIT